MTPRGHPCMLWGLVLGIPGLWLPLSLQAQTDPVALQGGRILTITQGVVDDAVLVMEDGIITALGAGASIPPEARIIDLAGKTVMPGLVDGFTNLGTADFPSFGKDDDEATDPVTPHLRIIDGLYPGNRFIPHARQSGVTTVLSAPAEGNLLSGQSALVQLHGSTVQEMVRRFPVGIHGSLGEAPKARYGPENRSPMTRMGSAALLRQTLVDAGAYAEKLARYEEEEAAFDAGEREKAPTPVTRDLKLEALLPGLRGEVPFIISADRFDDIHTALRISHEFGFEMILQGGAEAHRLAGELAGRGIPVIWGPSGAPHWKLEAGKGTPEGPALLAAAGVRFSFQTGSIENASGLLTEARTAFAFGLPYDEALKGLTLYPAMIFGVDEEIGSLEVGKVADLVVLDGDPLEEASRIERVFVRGREAYVENSNRDPT